MIHDTLASIGNLSLSKHVLSPPPEGKQMPLHAVQGGLPLLKPQVRFAWLHGFTCPSFCDVGLSPPDAGLGLSEDVLCSHIVYSMFAMSSMFEQFPPHLGSHLFTSVYDRYR